MSHPEFSFHAGCLPLKLVIVDQCVSFLLHLAQNIHGQKAQHIATVLFYTPFACLNSVCFVQHRVMVPLLDFQGQYSYEKTHRI